MSDIIFRGDAGDLSGRLEGAFGDIEGLLHVIGDSLVQDSRVAFTMEQLGDEKWPERYPGQADPPVNVAGVLSDLLRGRQPKARRFQRRPVLFDSGELAGSVAADVSGNTAVIGTAKANVGSYAATQFHGGLSSQTVTEDAKNLLEKFLKSKKGQPYEEHLAFLLDSEELNTNVIGRKFLGITEERNRWILNKVREWFTKQIEGGARGQQ